MAWTRYTQTGFEMGRAGETPFSDGALPPTSHSLVRPITGELSFYQTGRAGLGYRISPEVNQIRTAFQFSTLGNTDNVSLITVYMRESSDDIGELHLLWYYTIDQVSLLYEDASGTIVDRDDKPSTAIFSLHNTELSESTIGLIVEGGASAEATLYVNGEEFLSITGTVPGLQQAQTIVAVKVGETYSGFAGMAETHFDDWYIDTSSGGEPFAAPPTYRYGIVRPAAAGSYTNWTPISGANWQNIDESIGVDTDYNYTTGASNVDTFDCTGFSLPANSTIQSVIPIVRARAGKTSPIWNIRLVSYNGVSDYGSDQELRLGFLYFWERYTTEAGGGPWSEADVNSSEFGYELRS